VDKGKNHQMMSNHNKMILLNFDDTLFCSHDPQSVMDKQGKLYELNPKGAKLPG
jgi:hypothetical protein